MQSQINFTRANEHEADRIGIGVLRDAVLTRKVWLVFLKPSEKSNQNNVWRKWNICAPTHSAPRELRKPEIDCDLRINTSTDSLNFNLAEHESG